MSFLEQQQQSPTTSRSTRGASKYRRDQINMEIQKLRDLLPLSDSMKERLFQLQVMSLACIYIRKNNYLPHVVGMSSMQAPFRATTTVATLRQSEGYRAMRGFLLMMTKCGKIVYISDNASDYLGHSVAEIMCQGDSVFDLVDHCDHERLQSELMSGPPCVSDLKLFPDERIFVCRMNLSRTAKRQLQYHKYILMEGRYVHATEYYQTYQSLSTAPSLHIQPIFAAYCQMLINPENAEMLSAGNTSMFCTVHSMDLKFVHIDQMATHYLGYKNEDLVGKSWYHYLHLEHLQEVACKHRILCQRKDGAVMCLLRMQTVDDAWLWLHTVFIVKESCRNQPADGKRVQAMIYIICQVLSESEALSLQGNSWIYGIRNEFMAPSFDQIEAVADVFKDGDTWKDRVPEQQYNPPAPITTQPSPVLSSLLAVKKEPLPIDSMELSQFVVDKDLNNNTEPQDCTNFEFGNNVEDKELEALPEFCLDRTIKGPLPDLSGDLDEFFEEMEHPKKPTVQAGAQTTIKLPEKVKYTEDLLPPMFPLDSLLGPCGRKMPTIAKLLQGHFDGSQDNYESIQRRSRVEGCMQLTDSPDIRLTT